MTKNYEFPPNSVYSRYEVNRMEFTNFGNLKNMTPKFCYLVIIISIMFRSLIGKAFYEPWKIKDLNVIEDIPQNI